MEQCCANHESLSACSLLNSTGQLPNGKMNREEEFCDVFSHVMLYFVFPEDCEILNERSKHELKKTKLYI